MVAGVSCGSGTKPSHDRQSLIERVRLEMLRNGAPRPLAECLVRGLGDVLTEEDAARLYQDLASEPEVSERSLGRVSVSLPKVHRAIGDRAAPCAHQLARRRGFTSARVRNIVREVGVKSFGDPWLLSANR